MTDTRPNLVLTGFMGTGKSTVARLVAERTGLTLVAMDEMIAERAGMSIPEIFARQGEAAFRAYERVLCQELGARQGLVIDTGGGALVDADNREALARHGYLVCLDCEEPILLQRLAGDQSRPMLWGPDRERSVRDLLAARRPAYAEIPHHIDTGRATVEDVVQQTLALWRARPVVRRVHTPTGEYQVHVVREGLAHLGALLRARGVSSPVAAVSDEHVWPLYGSRVVRSLETSGLRAVEVVLPAGEQHKNLRTVEQLYHRFAAMGLDRAGAVIALGGGVITDLTGFAAATYMRGVPLVQAATTLLGMVDASVGGKVAVDLAEGKNLVGAFVRPLLVMCDLAALDTLPALERRAGMAEVLKAGIIADPTLFAALEEGDGADLGWAIQRAIDVKLAVVEADPYERGQRAVLNLGHTFAHAFEVLAGYELHHGLAVGTGMVAAGYLAELRGLCSSEVRTRIVNAVARQGLETTYTAHPPQAVLDAMRLDKKRVGKRLRLILPRAIGEVAIDGDVADAEILAALERIRS